MTVPPAQQCTLPYCTKRAVNPERTGALCQTHLDGLDAAEPDNTPEESADFEAESETSQETDTSVDDEPAVEPGLYPQDLVDVEQWLAWKATDDGRKVPRAPWTGGDPAMFVSAQDPEVWTDLGTVLEWCETLPGFEPAFNIRDRDEHPDEALVLIDYDDARDPETGEIHPTVREHVARAESYADVSTSGTGVHIFCRGALPDGVKAIEAALPEAEGFLDAEIEVYDSARFSAMTGDHVAGTPTETTDCQAFIEDLAEEFATVAEGTPDEMLREPETPKAELADVDTTDDIQDVLDAIQHTGPRDIRLRSTVTQERSDGSKSMDPSWARSDSGTRLAQIGDGWVYRKGMIGLDALQVVALEERIISRETEYPSGEDFWKAVEALRERGAHIPEYEPEECEPAAALPIGRLDALSPEERRRYAAKRGLEWPDTDEARERLRDAIFREMRAGNATVLDAPTALGKSYTVATEPWRRRADVTGEAPVVHLHATRDARDEAAAHTEASAASGAVLYGRGECCPLAAGEHDPVGDPESEDAPNVPVTVNGLSASEYFDLLCDEKGLPFSTAHALAREYNDQGLDELPCREDGECEAIRQWEGVPRDDDGNPSVDVVHATHQFAYVPTLRRHTNVVLDEQPDYSADLGQDRIRRMVNAYLREIGAPVTTWEAFVSLAKHTGSGGDAAAERDALDDMVGTDPGREWFVEDPDAHALAPDLTRALWNVFRWEEPDENGRRSTKVMHEPPRLDADSDGYAGTWLSVVVDDENTVRSVRNVPDFSQARAVVGLDAHPSMPMWELNAGPALTRDAVLEPEERRLWRRYERGLTVVQVGDATRPRSGSKALEWMNRDRVAAVVERIREHTTGDLTTAIAPQQVETAVRGILAEGGVDAETMHYGEEKSRNDFADESVGYLYGCMDPGDEMILDALAELDLAAQPATAETEDGETVREKGRTFVGPDADVAEAVLASVRENHVAQGAGRYARNPSEPDSGAVVYLHTDAAPTGFVDVEAPGVEWLATETQRAIIDALAERPSATTRDLAEAVGCSKEHIRETLGPLADRGLVARHDRAGAHGADVYRDTGVESARVDLGETANDPLQECNRWSLAIRNPARTASDASGGDGSSTTPRAVPDGGDGPPDEPE